MNGVISIVDGSMRSHPLSTARLSHNIRQNSVAEVLKTAVACEMTGTVVRTSHDVPGAEGLTWGSLQQYGLVALQPDIEVMHQHSLFPSRAAGGQSHAHMPGFC